MHARGECQQHGDSGQLLRAGGAALQHGCPKRRPASPHRVVPQRTTDLGHVRWQLEVTRPQQLPPMRVVCGDDLSGQDERRTVGEMQRERARLRIESAVTLKAYAPAQALGHDSAFGELASLADECVERCASGGQRWAPTAVVVFWQPTVRAVVVDHGTPPE